MRSAEWRRLVRPILGEQWRTARDLAYLVPVGWAVYGLLAERSAATGGVYLWRVRMPLYVPENHIVLDWSSRVGGGTRVYIDRDDLARAVRETAPLVEVDAQSASPVVERLQPGPESEPMLEDRAYGLALEGNVGQAIEVLGKVTRLRVEYDWQQDLVNRASDSRSMLQRGEIEPLRRRLEAWRIETIAALKLSET